jgi:hypothetical protein
VNVHECDTQLKVPYYTIFTSDPEEPVFTVDRNLGIEFFDHGGQSDRPDYLVDYVPSAIIENGYQIVITSRSLSELEALLYPVLERYGFQIKKSQTALLLEQLRLLSSRLALKLLSSSSQQAEVLGLALSCLSFKFPDRSSCSKCFRDQNMQFRSKTA